MNNKLSARHDKDIVQDIEKKLLVGEEFSTDNIHVDVNNGKVIVTGTVVSLEKKQEVEDIINNINGVKLVVNDLNVERI